MKNRTGLMILALTCVVLGIALIWTNKRASDRRSADAEMIVYHSNKWVETSASLRQQEQVNTSLESDLKTQRERYDELTNHFTQMVTTLASTEQSLTTARQEILDRNNKISDLESQNQALDQRALDLSTAITNLTVQIDDTRMKLAASEGDKAFLEKELQRLIAEKAELEKQFNDLAVLRAQVAKLKEELNISRRLEWIRQGLFARADQKGAEQLMQKSGASTNRPATSPYDLNVEISADGSVRVMSSATNSVIEARPAPSGVSDPQAAP